MASTPLKKRKNASILWEHARKVFRENGTVKHIKCNHCEKTFYGGITSNALNHLYRTHFNHLAPSVDSKKKPSHTYDLKCEIVKKASVPEENIDESVDEDDDIVHGEDENNGIDDKTDNNDDGDDEINRILDSHKKSRVDDNDDGDDTDDGDNGDEDDNDDGDDNGDEDGNDDDDGSDDAENGCDTENETDTENDTENYTENRKKRAQDSDSDDDSVSRKTTFRF